MNYKEPEWFAKSIEIEFKPGKKTFVTVGRNGHLDVQIPFNGYRIPFNPEDSLGMFLFLRNVMVELYGEEVLTVSHDPFITYLEDPKGKVLENETKKKD